MIGWLLDTNIISTIINPGGAPTVKAWAAGQDERRFFLSVLSLAEYDKGIYNLADDHPAKDVELSGAAVFDPWNDDPARFPLWPVTGSRKPRKA